MSQTPPATPPKMETETKKDPPKTETEKAPPKDLSEDEQALIEIRDEYKKTVSPEQWDAVKNLSIAKQLKILKVMQPAAAAVKDPAKPDIKTPLDSPAPVEHKIKTFLERQKEADFAKNLRDMGSYSHLAQKLYEKKNS